MVIPMVQTETPNRGRRYWFRLTAFGIMHLLPLGAIFTGMTRGDVALCISLYFGRMFFITGGFHRYFSHHAFKTNRVVQFLFAFFAQTSAQRGALWWAAHHRHHHRFSDMPEDVHSPHRGLFYSHVGWILDPANDRTKVEGIRDFAKYPELRFLDRWHILPAVMLGAACFWWGGASALFGGFFLSTMLLYHGTFTVNSLTHLWGTRRFVTRDTSRNNFLIALITNGEGWHNNHHHYPSTAKAGFRWWEIDLTYYILKGMSWVGLIHDLRPVTESAMNKNRVADGVPDIGMFQMNWDKATKALANQGVRTREVYQARRDAIAQLVEHTREQVEQIARYSDPSTDP